MEYTTCQQQAIDLFQEFLKSDERVFCLFGYAGTGKTYLVKALLDLVEDYEFKPVVAAPTNKAANVLADKLISETKRYEVVTIHKLLKLTPIASIDDLQFESGYATFSNKTILFLDEVSMLGKELEEMLVGTHIAKIVYIGDLAQLPPVKAETAELFATSYKFSIQLKTPIRQKVGSGLFDSCQSVRETGTILWNEQVRKCSRNHAIQALKNDIANECLILAYTNKVVNQLNVQAKSYPINNNNNSFGNKFENGDRLIANRSLYKYEGMQRNAAIESITLQNSYIYTLKNVGDKVLIDDGAVDTEIFWHDHDIDLLNKLIDLKRVYYGESLSAFNKKNGTKLRSSTDVILAYNYLRSETVFYEDYEVSGAKFLQDVSFAFCLTVHKSQGSTCKNVYICLADLQRSSKDTFRSLLYTAMTRATDNVYFF